MATTLATILLERASNGNELLQVLDTIAADQSDDPQPTAEEIQF